MAELSIQQKDVYNELIANGLDEKTAEGLVTGAINKDEYLRERTTKQPVNTKKEALAKEGFDFDLIENTTQKVKQKTEDFDDLNIMGLDETLGYYMPDKSEVFNMYGIRTNKEAPSDVRYKLSFGLNDPGFQVQAAKKLLAQNLIDEGMDKETVDQYKDKIVVKNQSVGAGNDQYQGLVFSIPKELGGDGYLYTFNRPGFDTSDLQGFAGDAAVITASIAGGTIGSGLGPVGTVGGSGFAAGTAEYFRLQTGRKYGMFDDMKEEEFDNLAFNQALKVGAIDAAATALFLPLAKVIKQQVFMAGSDRLSGDTVGKFIKSGGSLDEGMSKTINDAKKVLMNAGVDEKAADEYIAISVANAIPESGIITKGGVAEKAYVNALESANKRVQNLDIEKKILKTTTGLDDIDAKTSDNIIENIRKNVKNIREDELFASDKGVRNSFANMQKNKDNIFKTPEVNQIDKMGIVFNEVNERINSRLGILQQKIISAGKKNQFKVDIETNEMNKVLRNIFNEYDLTAKKKLPKEIPTGKKARAQYEKQKMMNEFVDFLDQNGGQFGLVKDQLKILKGGVNSMENLSFNNALAIRRALRNLDQAEMLPKGSADAVRKLKGVFDDAIDDAVSGNKNTKALIDEYDDLLFNYKNSFLSRLADEIGYGPKPQVVRKASLTGTGKSVFDQMIDSGKEGLNNAERLGNLINMKQFNFSQLNKIKGSLYQHYYDNVFPKAVGEKGKMTHKAFIDKYGKNYRLILGDDLYNKFSKSNQSVVELYDNLVKQNADIVNTVSKELPSLNVNLLDKGTGTAIADEIFRLGDRFDITPLIKRLSRQSNQLTTDIRKLYLQKMMNSVKTKVPGTNYRGLNGNLLDDFLTENNGVLNSLYGKEFVDSYRKIAKVLKLVQEPELAGAGKEGLTAAANKAGLFIDIFAGPLNHKRLIVNRLGRIYDGMNLGGDSLRLLSDYRLFTEGVKKQYLAGNYPRWLDTLGKSKKPKDKALFKRVLQALQPPRKLYDLKSNPLYAKEYMEDKITETVQGQDVPPGSPDVFTPIDAVVNKIIGKTGATIPKYLDKNLTPKIEKLIRAFKLGGKIQDKDYEREEFEKKLEK